MANDSIATISVTEVAYALVGLKATDLAIVNPAAALTAGLGISSVRCADDVLTVAFVNPTAGALLLGTGTLNVSIQRFS
jgi:hypothetical protein